MPELIAAALVIGIVACPLLFAYFAFKVLQALVDNAPENRTEDEC